jgi:hypothetical protein
MFFANNAWPERVSPRPHRLEIRLGGTRGAVVDYYFLGTDSRTSGAAGRKMMHASKASASEERLEIARKLYRALVAQDPNRVIILCDSTGKVLARHDLRVEQSDPEVAS